jgi:hypothetical protein
LRLAAVTFFLLAANVVVEGTRSLVIGETPDPSPVGMVLLTLSIIVMQVLAMAKRRVAMQLGGDPLILADAAETRMCVLLSAERFRVRCMTWVRLAGFARSAWSCCGADVSARCPDPMSLSDPRVIVAAVSVFIGEHPRVAGTA